MNTTEPTTQLDIPLACRPVRTEGQISGELIEAQRREREERLHGLARDEATEVAERWDGLS